MKSKVVITLLKTAWVLEMIIAAFILIVTVVQLLLTGKDSLTSLLAGQFDLDQFLAGAMNIIVGLKFMKMLVLHTPRAVTDVLLFAIARQLVVSHASPVDTLLGVSAVALIFVIKKFLHTKEDSAIPGAQPPQPPAS